MKNSFILPTPADLTLTSLTMAIDLIKSITDTADNFNKFYSQNRFYMISISVEQIPSMIEINKIKDEESFKLLVGNISFSVDRDLSKDYWEVSVYGKDESVTVKSF